MERYDSQSKELKFRTIDHENLIYFFNNLNNYGQENICISFQLLFNILRLK